MPLVSLAFKPKKVYQGQWAVELAQLIAQALRTPEVLSSNPINCFAMNTLFINSHSGNKPGFASLDKRTVAWKMVRLGLNPCHEATVPLLVPPPLALLQRSFLFLITEVDTTSLQLVSVY